MKESQRARLTRMDGLVIETPSPANCLRCEGPCGDSVVPEARALLAGTDSALTEPKVVTSELDCFSPLEVSGNSVWHRYNS